MYSDDLKKQYEQSKEMATNLYYETKGKIWADAERQAQEVTKAYNDIMEQIERAYKITLESYQNTYKERS
jgi:hypothetical protein